MPGMFYCNGEQRRGCQGLGRCPASESLLTRVGALFRATTPAKIKFYKSKIFCVYVTLLGNRHIILHGDFLMIWLLALWLIFRHYFKKNDFGALILALGPSYQRNREMLENSKGNFVEKQLHFETKNMGFGTNFELLPTPRIINILCK